MKYAYKKAQTAFPKDYEIEDENCHTLLAGFRSVCRCKSDCPGLFSDPSKKTATMNCAIGDYGSNVLAANWALPKKCDTMEKKKNMVYVPYCTCKKHSLLRKVIGKFRMSYKQPWKMCTNGGRLTSC